MIQLRRFPIAPAFVRFTADQLAAIELVMGYVHPGNLGALPPRRPTCCCTRPVKSACSNP